MSEIRPEPPDGMYYRGPTRNLKPDGTPVRRGGFAWKPGKRPKAGPPGPPDPPGPPGPPAGGSPEPSPSENAPQRKKKGLAATLTVTAAAGAVTVGVALSGSSNSGDTLTVQAKADLTQSIAALAKLGFDDASGARADNPGGGTDCASAATMRVRQFLAQHPCKEYAVSVFTVARSGIRTKVAITWVAMPTSSLASGYKAWADSPRKGNPPGQPEADFTGLCYASGQAGAIVWAEQVQPTGHPGIDQAVLRAMAPSEPATAYLKAHCPS